MAVFDKIQNIMDKTIAPVASKVADSKMLDALMGGMMCTLPMTLGVSVIAILINFPIRGSPIGWFRAVSWRPATPSSPLP